MPRKNTDTMSRQQKAALTRIANTAKRKSFVNGYMSGYLLGKFDGANGVIRKLPQLRKLAESTTDDNV